MKPEKETARIVLYKDESINTPSRLMLGVKVDERLYAIEGVLPGFYLDASAIDDFSNVNASFCIYDLETVK